MLIKLEFFVLKFACKIKKWNNETLYLCRLFLFQIQAIFFQWMDIESMFMVGKNVIFANKFTCYAAGIFS